MATATTRDAALEVTARKEVEEEEEHWDRGTEIIPYFGIIQKLNSRMKDLLKVNLHEIQTQSK